MTMMMMIKIIMEIIKQLNSYDNNKTMTMMMIKIIMKIIKQLKSNNDNKNNANDDDNNNHKVTIK